MAAATYILCALTMLLCAVLLLQAFARVRRLLLLWSGICFAGLALSNFLIFFDLVVFREIDLYPWRLLTAVAAMAILLGGLIWEDR